MLITFFKAPKWIQHLLTKWKLLTDVSAMVIVYLILGGISKSIVAIVGAIFTGLLVGVTLELAANKITKKESTWMT
jgi:hypothetical protein